MPVPTRMRSAIIVAMHAQVPAALRSKREDPFKQPSAHRSGTSRLLAAAGPDGGSAGLGVVSHCCGKEFIFGSEPVIRPTLVTLLQAAERLSFLFACTSIEHPLFQSRAKSSSGRLLASFTSATLLLIHLHWVQWSCITTCFAASSPSGHCSAAVAIYVWWKSLEQAERER